MFVCGCLSVLVPREKTPSNIFTHQSIRPFAATIYLALLGKQGLRQLTEVNFAKAHYFTLAGRSPFSRLVYPVASRTFLGVHVTLDLAGQARFGPDIQWVDAVDYSFDESRAALFYDAVRRYFPDLRDGALQPGYTGIRPKISGPRDPAADFVIEGPRDHGIPGIVNLFGIESPGLTSSLAIGTYVADLLRR